MDVRKIMLGGLKLAAVIGLIERLTDCDHPEEYRASDAVAPGDMDAMEWCELCGANRPWRHSDNKEEWTLPALVEQLKKL